MLGIKTILPLVVMLVGVESYASACSSEGKKHCANKGMMCKAIVPGYKEVCKNKRAENKVYKDKGLFKVVVENITKNQPLTPPVAIIGNYGQDLFSEGKKASKSLRLLAEDGDTSGFEYNLHKEIRKGNLDEEDIFIGKDIIMPGESYEFMIGSDSNLARKHSRLTFVSMLARTNDAFVGHFEDVFGTSGGFGHAGTPGIKVGEASVSYASIYDAGTEVNTESCKHIPAPPCRSVKSRVTKGAEGSVKLHQGLHLEGDLTYQDAFSRKGARITITRVK